MRAKAKKRPLDEAVVTEPLPNVSVYYKKLILTQYSFNDSVKYTASHKGRELVFRGLEGLSDARRFAAKNGYLGIIVESASWKKGR